MSKRLTEAEMVKLEDEIPALAAKAFREAYEEVILSGRPVLVAEKICGVWYVVEKRLIGKASCEPPEGFVYDSSGDWE
jgi:hypothetical protein